MERKIKAVKYKMRRYIPCLTPWGLAIHANIFIAGQNVKSGKIEVET